MPSVRAAVHLVALIYSGCLNSFNHLTPLTSTHEKKKQLAQMPANRVIRAAAALQIFSSEQFPLLSSLLGLPHAEKVPVKLHMANWRKLGFKKRKKKQKESLHTE